MIFSFTKNSETYEINVQDSATDVCCFFDAKHSVKCPADEWFWVAMTSLKLKKNVLILETNVPWPQLDLTRRWQVGEGWLWIAPRGRSVILDTYKNISPNIVSLRAFLTSSK